MENTWGKCNQWDETQTNTQGDWTTESTEGHKRQHSNNLDKWQNRKTQILTCKQIAIHNLQLKIVLLRCNSFCTHFVIIWFGMVIWSTLHLADTFIQSYLQLIWLSRRHSPLEQCGVKGLAQGPNCADLIVATPGIEPPTLQVQVKQLNHYATGYPI